MIHITGPLSILSSEKLGMGLMDILEETAPLLVGFKVTLSGDQDVLFGNARQLRNQAPGIFHMFDRLNTGDHVKGPVLEGQSASVATDRRNLKAIAGGSEKSWVLIQDNGGDMKEVFTECVLESVRSPHIE
jgi:hypothetical protein